MDAELLLRFRRHVLQRRASIRRSLHDHVLVFASNSPLSASVACDPFGTEHRSFRGAEIRAREAVHHRIHRHSHGRRGRRHGRHRMGRCRRALGARRRWWWCSELMMMTLTWTRIGCALVIGRGGRAIGGRESSPTWRGLTLCGCRLFHTLPHTSRLSIRRDSPRGNGFFTLHFFQCAR